MSRDHGQLASESSEFQAVERQETLISTSQILIKAAVLVLVPTDGDGGAAKVFLEFVLGGRGCGWSCRGCTTCP